MTEANAQGAIFGQHRPRDMVFTLFGVFRKHIGDWIAIADVIAMMDELGVDSQATRSTVLRLKNHGLLAASRAGGAAGYRLTAQAIQALSASDPRIFERRIAVQGDGWLLVLFSIPESERSKRHQLRSKLIGLAFGTAAPGVWIAPAHVEAEARAALSRLDLAEYVDLFVARHVDFVGRDARVADWWDLQSINALAQAFCIEHGPVLDRWSAQGGLDPATAFRDYMRLIDSWRKLVYADPRLPDEVLPGDWSGFDAENVYFKLQEILEGPAADYVRVITRGNIASL